MTKQKGIRPAIISDGTKVFKKFTDEYITHDYGLFIFAPSGSGKTHFVKNQKEKHWIDGDDLWMDTGAAPTDIKWWTMGLDIITEVDIRSDLITMYAKKLGLWVIGASQYWLPPDAIFIPDWETHKKYIGAREKGDYDGGATTSDYDQVLGHISYMKKLAKRENMFSGGVTMRMARYN